jgi:hypothetical protein
MLWLKPSFDLVLGPRTKQSAVPSNLPQSCPQPITGLAAFPFSLYLGFSRFSVFPLLYGFQTPPIRIATISRILKILYPLRVTSWGSIPLPYNSVSDPALRARTRRADERISDADTSSHRAYSVRVWNDIIPGSWSTISCSVWTHGGVLDPHHQRGGEGLSASSLCSRSPVASCCA